MGESSLMPPSSGYLENRRGRLYYHVSGQGPAIVLCHALGTDSSLWSDLEADLARSGAAHFPNLEAPERFNALVLDWLTRGSKS